MAIMNYIQIIMLTSAKNIVKNSLAKDLSRKQNEPSTSVATGAMM